MVGPYVSLSWLLASCFAHRKESTPTHNFLLPLSHFLYPVTDPHLRHLFSHYTTLLRYTYASPAMVNYYCPKYCPKAERDVDYNFSARHIAKDGFASLRMPTCLRCIVSISQKGAYCNKPYKARCEHCVKGRRGGCALVSDPRYAQVQR